MVDSYGAEPSVWSRRPPRRPRAACAEIGDKALPMSAMGQKLTWRDRAGTSASEGRAEIWTWRWSLSWLATFRSSISIVQEISSPFNLWNSLSWRAPGYWTDAS